MSRRTISLAAAALLCWLMAYWLPGAATAAPSPAEPVLGGGLAEPEAVKPGTLMPDLSLSAAEINQLSAFLLAD